MNEILTFLPYSVPVILAALGEIIVQKSGLINIGLEGMMLLGAFVAFVAAVLVHGPLAVTVAFVLAMAAGGFLAFLSSGLTVWLGSDQVVVGTAVNLLCLGLTSTLFRDQFGMNTQLPNLPMLSSSLRIGALKLNHMDAVLLMIPALICVVWAALNKTQWGLAVRAAGEFPKSVEAAGFAVQKLRMVCLTIGGVFAGAAGAYLVLGLTGSFAENMTNGRGFIAIAIVTFGRWRPIWVFFAAVLLGYLNSLQFTLQASHPILPFQAFVALPYVVALLVLVFSGKGAIGPASLGQPYRREK